MPPQPRPRRPGADLERGLGQPALPDLRRDGECLLAETGDLVRCVRRESKWPVAEGGWMHRLKLGRPARAVAGIRPEP